MESTEKNCPLLKKKEPQVSGNICMKKVNFLLVNYTLEIIVTDIY